MDTKISDIYADHIFDLGMNERRSRRNSSFSSSAFDDWADINNDVLQFLTVFTMKSGGNMTLFNNFKRQRIAKHQRALEDIKNFIDMIAKEENDTKGKIRSHQMKDPNLHASSFYDDQQDNMMSRMRVFLHCQINAKNLKFLIQKLNFLNTKKEQAYRIMNLIVEGRIPTHMVITINENFYDININNKYTDKIKLMNKKIKEIEYRLSGAKVEWLDYRKFFKDLVADAMKQINQELFYFPFLDREIKFARYLFNYPSRDGQAINLFITKRAVTDFEDFPTTIIEFCSAMVPPNLLETASEQSVSLLLFFRVIMDRIYETQTHRFDPSSLSGNMGPVYQLPLSSLTLPLKMSPVGEPNELARNVFMRNQLFSKASQTLLMSFFTVNPIDGLYYVHSAMADIHYAAVTTSVGREPTSEELKQILGFDDLFSLFFGVLVASDIPDPFQLHIMMKTFAPKSCLSPMFEYANANLEALVLHCGRVCARSAE